MPDLIIGHYNLVPDSRQKAAGNQVVNHLLLCILLRRLFNKQIPLQSSHLFAYPHSKLLPLFFVLGNGERLK
jgi:hypothetical protein